MASDGCGVGWCDYPQGWRISTGWVEGRRGWGATACPHASDLLRERGLSGDSRLRQVFPSSEEAAITAGQVGAELAGQVEAGNGLRPNVALLVRRLRALTNRVGMPPLVAGEGKVVARQQCHNQDNQEKKNKMTSDQALAAVQRRGFRPDPNGYRAGFIAARRGCVISTTPPRNHDGPGNAGQIGYLIPAPATPGLNRRNRTAMRRDL